MAHGRSSPFLMSLSPEEQVEQEESQPRTPITVDFANRPMAERIAASVENWQRKLLDLTKRNRALNFRMNKVSTVAVVDEHPVEVFRQLYIRGEAMRFKAAPEPDDHGDANTEHVEPPADGVSLAATIDPDLSGIAVDEDEEVSLSQDFAPYDPTTLDDRHTDEWLQTAATPDVLDKSLRRLDVQARSTLEEQGVNTLFLTLGMLHYTESNDSKQTYLAPLLLLPVELSRKSARTGYQIRVTDEDPIVNPALAEYLKPLGIILPDLPEANVMPEDYDLQQFFTAVLQAISGKKNWTIKTDISLGLFSFQKFVMYKDLETNAQSLATHRLIQQLITRSGNHIVGLPTAIRLLDLDQEYPPEATFQVVDADSSQLRAIAACAKAHDLVIEGPPGTGKSQTITNLIAQALAAGKSVLFVAEKMAALEVVYNRLVQASLGEFCLELHSTKANKRAVMKELAASLDASFQNVAVPTVSTDRLPHVRNILSEYVRAVHTPYGTLGCSPYQAYGELGQVYGAPRVRYDGQVDRVTFDQLHQTIRNSQDLAATSTAIGVPAQHPWRDATKTLYTEDDLETVRELTEGLLSRLTDVIRRAEAVCGVFGFSSICTFLDIETAAEVAVAMKHSPGAPLSVLQNESWNAPPPEASTLVERGRELERLRGRIQQHFSTDVLEQEHATDIAYVERKSQGFLSCLAFLDGRYRSIRKRWLEYRLPTFHGSLIDQAHEMKQVDRLCAERTAINSMETHGREIFGGLWQGERSSWDVLENYIRWVVEFRGLCVRHGLEGRAVEIAAQAAPDVSDVEALKEAAADVLVVLGKLYVAVGWPEDYLTKATFTDIAARLRAVAQNIARGPQWAAFEAARQMVERGLAGDLLPAVMSGQVAFRELAPAFLRAFYMKWLAKVVQEREGLARFSTLTHEERVNEFKRLDERVLKENRAALVGQLRDRIQYQLQQPEAAAQLPYLRREMARQRQLAPLRRTMKQAEAAVRAIKPCFMMSPLTAAQYLDGATPSFDLIIFDEASQLPAEDAVGAIIRGKQLVVVGDPKQLPPTNFFSVMTGQVSAPLADDGTPLYEDTESILEAFMGAGVPMSRLKWHYRSAHESLINFSNVSFYESDLYTFPSVETGTDHCGLQFEYIPDGIYEGKGLNHKEARRVADAVAQFAKEQLARQERGEPVLSLGVGTFNLRQQLAIQDELELRRREDPSIELFFDRGRVEPFFVKNLENIQGDERDVIFISVTYAKGVDGKLRYHFGPLNGENGWRRLNVLITRARQRMQVFSSMRGDEINAAATTSNGARLLREFLLYAERGRLESISVSLAAETESPFERDVFNELTRRNIQVLPQVGVAGYRIDLGVLDNVMPGRFLCGIECDGLTYHASETARDRDRLRQQVLEARGWTIHRVWSTDWFKDRQGQIERLLQLIEETRARARETEAAEREAQERARAEAEARVADEAEAAHILAERQGQEKAIAASAEGDHPYERPIASLYMITPGEGQYTGSDLLVAPFGQLAQAVTTVVETESPLHMADILSRVAGMWGTRVGSRIQARILDACQAVERDGRIQRRGDFFWSAASGGRCTFRSRSGLRIPGDRIAPEEYREVLLAVLSTGHTFSRAQLTNEVRAVLGFSRTGAILDEAIGSAITLLLQEGKLGETSTGLRLRI